MSKEEYIEDSFLLKSLINTSIDGILAFDRDCRYIAWNSEMERISGKKREDVVGKLAFEIFPFLKQTGEDKYFFQALEGQNVIAKDRSFSIPETGRAGYFDAHYSPFFDKSGNVIGGIGIIRNITEQKVAEEASRKAEERFRRLVESTNVIAWEADLATGLFTYVSPQAVKLLGYELKEWYEEGFWTEHIHAEDREYAVNFCLESSKHLTEYEFEYRMIAADDRTVWLRDIVSVVLREDGTKFLHGFLIDISEQKAVEESLLMQSRVLESMVEGVSVSDENGIILFTNPSEDAMFGYERGELVGKHVTVQNTYPPEENARIVNEVIQQLIIKGSWAGEFSNKKKDGTAFTTSARISKLDMGRKKYLICVQEDITERKASEEALNASQVRLNLALESARMGAWEWDIVTGKITWSDTLEPLHGLNPGEFNGSMESFIQLIHPEDQEFVINTINRCLEHDSFYDIEFRILWPDNSVHWLNGKGKVFRDKENKPVRMIGIGLDITDRKYLEEQLKFLVEASITLSSSLDYETTLANVANLAVPKIADWCAIDLIADDLSTRRLATAHVDPNKAELIREIYRCYPPKPADKFGIFNVFRTGKSELYTQIADSVLEAIAYNSEHLELIRSIGIKSSMIVPLKARRKVVGAITFISNQAHRLYDDADLTFAEDLANRVSIAIENAQLYREAQDANRLKDEFLATISHELRTPLTSILGWARLIGSGSLNEKDMARGIDTIIRNAHAQSQLIEDMLDMSRIITGKMKLDITPIDLTSVIEATIDMGRPAAEAKGIKLQRLLDAGPSKVFGDSTRLQQVVWNLVSNAIKFTPQGGRIEVKLERANSNVEIVVSDTGEGIKPDILPFIFDRFRQADSSITRKHGGLGLGLAIVRYLVELHGGTVHAESLGEGQGSRFIVKLPLAKEDQTDTNSKLDEDKEMAMVSRRDCFTQGTELEGLRILVVDDDQDARILISEVLKKCGAEVTDVSTATEALDTLKNKDLDILLSDIGMPEEDGYTFIRKVRRSLPNHKRDIPAAALTAYTGLDERMRLLRAGFQIYMSKPIEPEELVTVVASLAGRTQARTSS